MRFFHQRKSQRHLKNQVVGIFYEREVWQNLEDKISNVTENYFQKFVIATNGINLETVLDKVDRLVTPDMNYTLIQDYIADEVKRALFQMHPSKSLGLDGVSPFFSQKYWHILGPNVTNAILSVLCHGILLRKMNFTHIIFGL